MNKYEISSGNEKGKLKSFLLDHWQQHVNIITDIKSKIQILSEH